MMQPTLTDSKSSWTIVCVCVCVCVLKKLLPNYPTTGNKVNACLFCSMQETIFARFPLLAFVSPLKHQKYITA